MMLTVTSRKGRWIIGRLERGDDLIQGLLMACNARQVRCGAVSALGALESVEVTHYDTQRKKYKPSRYFSGPLEILSLVGNLSESDGELMAHLHATLSREGDNGIEVVGGHLVTARVFACEFTIQALDDVLLRRGLDRPTGLKLWKDGFEADADAGTESGLASEENDSAPSAMNTPVAEVDQASGPAAAGGSVSAGGDEVTAAESPLTAWAEVATASEKARASGIVAAESNPVITPVAPAPTPEPEPAPEDEEDDDDLGDFELTPGDIIEHPKFGRCVVARVEGADEFVQVRLRNKNLVRLSLDIVTLVLVGSEGGRQVFKAKIEG